MSNDASVTPPDDVLAEIARYVAETPISSEEAYRTAHIALFDAIGCGLLALRFPACTRLLGPLVPGTVVPHGARVPGTAYVLDPVQAAFNIGAMNRWLDFNDTWLAAEWGHPSDNFAGILAIADWLSQTRVAEGQPPLLMREVLTAAIKAYEIQGILALENAFNRVGLDHVLLVRTATSAVVTKLLGGDASHILTAISHAFMDGGTLRAYRHEPNTGSRKSWAAGDASSRGVRLALLARTGEMGYPQVLSAKTWGFYDVLFAGRPFALARPLGSYVMEHVLFKVSFPAEFHAQTALECAIQLHPQVAPRLAEVERVAITTQESAIRIIAKTGPLHNPADRDHCLQYIVAIGLLNGDLTADDYEDAQAADPRIDWLRARTTVAEDPAYSADYLDPEKRSVANAVQVFFADGSSTEQIAIDYPIGHRRRREEALPLLARKFGANITSRLSPPREDALLALWQAPARLAEMPVHEFMGALTI